MSTESAPPQIRYQFKPFIGSSHWWALLQVDSLKPAHSVLDIGPGSGQMGRELRTRGATRLCAVEIDDGARKNAESIYDSVKGDMVEFEGEKFDLVLLLDVIEHTAEPLEFLQKAFKFVAPGGSLLLSVPNIAHWTIRFSLLFGFFEYTNRGLLDRTHLQFFTRKRVRDFVFTLPESKVGSFTASIEPAELLLPEKITGTGVFKTLSQLRVAVADLVPGFLAYQHLVRVTRIG